MANYYSDLYDLPPGHPDYAWNRSLTFALNELARLNLLIYNDVATLIWTSTFNSVTELQGNVQVKISPADWMHIRFRDSNGNRVAGVKLGYFQLFEKWQTANDFLFHTSLQPVPNLTNLGINSYTIDAPSISGRIPKIISTTGHSDTVDYASYYWHFVSELGLGDPNYQYYKIIPYYVMTAKEYNGQWRVQAGPMLTPPWYSARVAPWQSQEILTSVVDPDVRILNPDDTVADFGAMVAALEAVRDRLDDTEPAGLGARMAAAVHEETGVLAMVPAFAGAAAGAVPASLGTVATVLGAIAALLSIGGSLYNAVSGLGGSDTRTADGLAIESSLDRIFQNIASHRDEMERNWDATNLLLTEKLTLINTVLAGIKTDWRFEVTYPDPRIYTPGELLASIKEILEAGGGSGGGTIDVDLQPLVDAITAYQAAVLSGSSDYATMIKEALETIGDKYFIIDESGTRYNIATLMGYLLNHRTINIT